MDEFEVDLTGIFPPEPLPPSDERPLIEDEVIYLIVDAMKLCVEGSDCIMLAVWLDQDPHNKSKLINRLLQDSL